LIFEHTRNYKTQAVSGPYLSAGKNAQLLSGDGYIGFCGGAGGIAFWLVKGNQTFMCPDALAKHSS
jgi:hypothetical protein